MEYPKIPPKLYLSYPRNPKYPEKLENPEMGLSLRARSPEIQNTHKKKNMNPNAVEERNDDSIAGRSQMPDFARNNVRPGYPPIRPHLRQVLNPTVARRQTPLLPSYQTTPPRQSRPHPQPRPP